jgi:hypothetical protein
VNVLVDNLGPLQYEIYMRAFRSAYWRVTPAGARERKAIRRLEARGLLRPALGLPDVWTADFR